MNGGRIGSRQFKDSRRRVEKNVSNCFLPVFGGTQQEKFLLGEKQKL